MKQIVEELNDPLLDQRSRINSQKDEDLFWLLSNESKETFKVDLILLVQVVSSARKKLNEHEKENTISRLDYKTGLYPCPIFHAQKIEVLIQFMNTASESCKGEDIGVNCRSDNNLKAILAVTNMLDNLVRNLFNVVKNNGYVSAVIIKIDYTRMT